MKTISVEEMFRIIERNGDSYYIYTNFYTAGKGQRYNIGFILDGTKKDVVERATEACNHVFIISK